jgi:septum formation protein
MPFEVMAPQFVEQLVPHLPAGQQAAKFAAGKAGSCAINVSDALVIGSDTLISLGSEVLGKPLDLIDAEAMLRRMAGETHTIYTAVALMSQDRGLCDVQVAAVHVTMKPFDEESLSAYLRTGESLGKAGSYSIQGAGAGLIERIAGDYTAAVGLPLRMVAGMLQRREITCPVDLDRLYALRPYPNWIRFGS